MRTIHRDIVGGFIFSKDGKLLLGKNRKGGVYEDSLVVPGGGINEGETQLEALRREMLEETGIDIDRASVTTLFVTAGAHEKTLRDTGERVFVKMDFNNFRIDLPTVAADTKVTAEDDWYLPQWFSTRELADVPLSPPTQETLVRIGILSV